MIPFKGACAIKWGASLFAGIWYIGKEYLARVAASLSEPSWLLPSFFEQFKESDWVNAQSVVLGGIHSVLALREFVIWSFFDRVY